MSEGTSKEPHELNQTFSQMHYDIISKSTLFKELSSESIKQILSLAKTQALQQDSLIFREGDQPESFYIVISGQVRIFVTSPEGEEKTLAQLEPGDGFGEIALLTGAPHKYSAEVINITSLLVLPKKYLEQLCNLYPDISMALIKSFANRLDQKDDEIFQAGEKETAYKEFISQQDDLPLPEIIGQTRIVNNLRKKIYAIAENNLPALILGEPGTEKIVVAGTIHKNSNCSWAPFLSMDADGLTIEGYGAIPDKDNGQLQLEIAQSSVLFGNEKQTFTISHTRKLGLLQICSKGTVVIENIDKLSLGVQQKLHDFLVHGTFQTIGGQKLLTSSARILATSSKDLDELVHEGLFEEKLLSILQNNLLTVPPIKKRKSDLRLLVDFFIIKECFKTPGRRLIKGVSTDAYQLIMEYDWPGNMDELQIVIRRAINLTQGDYLIPEDIFIGIAPPEGKHVINLLQFEKINSFFKSNLYPVGLQIVTTTVFGLIFFMLFMGSQSPNANVSLILVWGMWEPLLFVSWFVGARVWCSVCPMGAMNDLLNKIGRKKIKVPKFVSDYGIYFGAVGLIIIIWAEVATDMPYSPMATGFLLLSITSFAILSGIFFERRLWCRYLCPLGTLGAIYSGCSIVEWRSNNSICNSTCKDNICYKGDSHTKGCPLYQGPFSLHSNKNCILCGRCLKLCPNDSPVLNIRIPGHELWAALKPEKVTIIFVPVIIGTQVFRGIVHMSFIRQLDTGILPMWSVFANLLLVATIISFIYMRISGHIAFSNTNSKSFTKESLFIYSIIPLIFAFELAYQLNPLLTRVGHFLPTLGRQLGFNWEFLGFVYQASSIESWQIFLILLGICAAIVFSKVLRKNHQINSDGFYRKRVRNVPIFFLGIIYVLIFTMK